MKLLNNKYNYSFDFNESLINELICESPDIFTDIIIDINGAYNGLDTSIILSDDSLLVDFKKYCDIIFDPFTIEINNKKNLDALYNSLIDLMNKDDLYIKKNTIHADIINYLECILFDSDFNLTYNNCIENKFFLKLLDVKIDVERNSLLDTLDSYMSISNKLLGDRVYIFINLKSFLSLNDIILLYKSAMYNKYKLLLIENIDRESLKDENKIIIDKTGCIIA